jgi:hypothetical protein
VGFHAARRCTAAVRRRDLFHLLRGSIALSIRLCWRLSCMVCRWRCMTSARDCVSCCDEPRVRAGRETGNWPWKNSWGSRRSCHFAVAACPPGRNHSNTCLLQISQGWLTLSIVLRMHMSCIQSGWGVQGCLAHSVLFSDKAARHDASCFPSSTPLACLESLG